MTTVQITGQTELVEPWDTVEHVGPSRVDVLLRRAGRPVVALRAVPHVSTYAGILLTVAGGVLLLVAWVKTARLTSVGLQMPFVISAGCTGLGLVAVGLTVVNLAAKAEDARRRQAQTAELHDLLAELRKAVESSEDAR